MVTLKIDSSKLVQSKSLKLFSDSNNLVNYSLSISYPYIQDKSLAITKSRNIYCNAFKITKRITSMNGEQDIKTGDVLKIELEIEPNKELLGGYISCDNEGVFEIVPDHIEFHKDKVLAFYDKILPYKFKFAYYVRVVYEGKFYIKPTIFSLMY